MTLETIQAHLYDYPAYYDLVFGSDWRAEYEFLSAALERYARPRGSEPGAALRIFEPACGTGRLLYRLARDGHEVSGLDLNAKAVDFCNDRLERHQLPRSTFVGDMTSFKLRKKVDAGFNMINSFRHLREERQAEDHFRCMGAAIRKGGVYLLGLHLTPTQGRAMDEESWSARRGHLCVNTHLWTIDRNTRTRQERFGMTCDVYTPTRSFRIAEEIVFRTYSAEQFQALVDRTEVFRVEATFDFGYEIDEPIVVGPRTQDVVYVLRRV